MIILGECLDEVRKNFGGNWGLFKGYWICNVKIGKRKFSEGDEGFFRVEKRLVFRYKVLELGD